MKKKKTQYQIRKEKIEQDAIKHFCYALVCGIQARDHESGMRDYNQAISLPREVAMVLLDKDLPKFFPKDIVVGTAMGRNINLY